MRAGEPLSMRSVAAAGGVSRSTLYRHFANLDDLRRAMREETLVRASEAIEVALAERRPALVTLRRVVAALVELGAELPIAAGVVLPSGLSHPGVTLVPLAERLVAAAGLVPPPARPWLEEATAHFVESCLRAGWERTADPGATVERLFDAVTDPLDRGLLLLDPAGVVLSSNPAGRAELAGGEPGRPVALPAGGLFEDGSPAPPESHPVHGALVLRGERQGIRGRRADDGAVRWTAFDVRVLRRALEAEPYGFVAISTDVTDEQRYERASLRPAGGLAGEAVPVLDVVRVLDEVPPALLPEQLVAEATRIAAGPVALYVLDIDGSHLLRLAGTEEFPPRIPAPLALGPELAEDGYPDLVAHLAEQLPGVVPAPMWLRGRAVGVLLARRGSSPGCRRSRGSGLPRWSSPRATPTSSTSPGGARR